MQDAASLAAGIDDRIRQGHARIHLGLCYVAQKQFEKAIATLEPVSEAQNVASRDLAVAANYYLNLCFHAQGSYRRAVKTGDRGMGMIPAEERTSRFRTSTVPAANMRAINVASLAELGEFQPIPALVDEAIAIVEATTSLYAKVLVLIYCALASIRQGKRLDAWAVLARLQSVPGGESVAITRARYLVTIGEACLRSGRSEEALTTMKLIPQVELLEGSPRGGTAPLIVLAEAYLANARPADAMTHAERALALTRKNGERGCEAWSLRLRGEIALTGHPLPQGDAAHWFGQGIALASQLEMRPLAAHCRLGLGKALRQVGRQPEGDREIETATAEYRAMDMPHWLEQAEAEMKALGPKSTTKKVRKRR